MRDNAHNPREPVMSIPRTAALALVGLLVGFDAPARAQAPPPRAGLAEEAAAGLRRAAALDAAFDALAKTATDADARDLVAEIWRLWLQSGRADVDALMARALAAMGTRDLGLASLLLDEVVELAPGFAEGWNRRATLRFLMSDHAGSLADIERVLSLEPRHFGALAGRAMIHAAAGRWREAVANYRRALAANPFLPERHRVLPALERKLREEL